PGVVVVPVHQGIFPVQRAGALGEIVLGRGHRSAGEDGRGGSHEQQPAGAAHRSSFARTRRITASTTLAIGIVVVSMRTASGASTRGETVRVVSDRSRASIAAATAACPAWLPVCATSLARRRARSSADASRYTFTSASG